MNALNQHNKERIRARLQKILALARQGVGGEKENAERMLDNLLKKHGLTVEDLDDENEPRDTAQFRYKGKTELAILTQCAAKVLNTSDVGVFGYRRGGRKVAGLAGIDVTKGEEIELRLMFDAHRAAFKKYLKKQESLALNAYIQKNKIFPDVERSADDAGPSISMADMMAIAAMMDGMEATSVYRQIGGPSA